jgi:spermidine synthase
MAHLPILLHPNPQKALVICFGMGTTFPSFAAHDIEVRALELVPEEIETFPLFYEDGAQLLKNPRYTIEINDGRNHLLLTKEKYDIIQWTPLFPFIEAAWSISIPLSFIVYAKTGLLPMVLCASGFFFLLPILLSSKCS